MPQSTASLLFLRKADDPDCARALEYCRNHFALVTFCLGKWGDPLPEDIRQWRGDYIISYLSRWVVPQDLLDRARIAAINFHPASPEYPGIGCNNFALCEDAKEYGVTCHHMVFSLYTLITRPTLFQATISENPFMNPDNAEYLLPLSEQFFRKRSTLKHYLHMRCENSEQTRALESARRFAAMFDSTKPLGFRMKVEFKEPSGDFIPALPFSESLRSIFAGYKLPTDFQTSSLQDILNYYKKRSEEHGFPVDPPDLMLTFEGVKLQQRGMMREAIGIFTCRRAVSADDGAQAALQTPGVYPYAAMMQVAAADTHQDYVICRGFDIRVNKFVDYEAGNADKPGISVAKPYDKRQIGNYEIAQIFLAFLPLQSSNPSPTAVPWRVGQNPGVSEVTPGHPASLSEKVDELQDAESKLVNWMLVDSGGGRDRARWVQATLVDKMCCQTGTFALSNPVNLDNDDDVSDVTEAENDFKLQATAGSTVLLKWRYPTDDWLIVQVLHQCEDMIFDIRYDGGCVIEKNTTEVSYMSCDPPT